MTAVRQHAASGNHLFFEVGGSRFCAPVDDVEAIVELSGVHRLPFAPKGIAGTFMFRDHVAVVCDLSDVLNVEASSARKDLSVVVRLPIGLVAFRVDHVSDIVAASEVRPQAADERAMKEWMDGYVMQGPHIAFLTRFEKLLSLFGVSSLANLEAAARAAQAQDGKAKAEPIAAGAMRGEPVAMVGKPAPAHVDAPEQAAAAPIDSAGVPAPSMQQAQAVDHEPAEAPIARIDAAVAPEVASQQADFEPMADGESAAEIVAFEPEPVALPGSEPTVGFAPEIAESRELVPEEEVTGDDAPIDSAVRLEAAMHRADVEPLSEAGSAPEVVAFEPESVVLPEAAFAAEPAPDGADWVEDLPEQEPRASLAEMQSADAAASPMQESEHEIDIAAEPVAASDGEAQDGRRPAEIDEALPPAEEAAVSPAEPEHSVPNRLAVETVHPNRRGNVVWESDLVVNSEQAASSPTWIAEPNRSSPPAEPRETGSGKRSYMAIAIAAAALPLAFAGAWWWVSGPAIEQAGEARQVTAIQPAQQQATGPIEQQPSKLEIVGKDFEMRVEAASSRKGKAPPTPASPNETVHVVVRGDTLWDIAAKNLGNPYRYPELARNSAIRNPDLIHPGDVVRVRKRR